MAILRTATVVLFVFACAARGGEAPSGGLAVWVEPATKKLFADSPPGADQALDLAAARGEWESAQIVLRTGRAATVKWEISSLQGPEGASLPASALEVRRVERILVPYAGKAYPDPLVPLSGATALPPDESVSFLVTVRVPLDAKPGEYRGEIKIAAEGAAPALVPAALRIWPFAIPEKPSVATAFGISRDLALAFEGVKADTPEGRAMHERYYRALLDHRISAYEIPVDILDPDAAKFLDDPRVTSFMIPYRDDLAWVAARVERAREKKWLDRAYFYPLDEPVSDEQYRGLADLAAKIRSIDPKLRIVSPFFRDAASGKSAYDALEGMVTIWCSVSAYFRPDRMEEKRRAGGAVWWYVCCGPGSPHANLHLTMDAIDHRILPWQMYKYRIEGFLYWSTTYWNPAHIKNPWLDMVTVPDINKNLSGDGSLFYPGRLPSGERVAVGPIASLRLVMLRDGFEDLEYLVLLEKRFGRQAAEVAAGRLVRDLTSFAKDPRELESVRREIAERLAKP